MNAPADIQGQTDSRPCLLWFSDVKCLTLCFFCFQTCVYVAGCSTEREMSLIFAPPRPHLVFFFLSCIFSVLLLPCQIVRTNQIPRMIPQTPWYVDPKVCVLLHARYCSSAFAWLGLASPCPALPCLALPYLFSGFWFLRWLSLFFSGSPCRLLILDKYVIVVRNSFA